MASVGSLQSQTETKRSFIFLKCQNAKKNCNENENVSLHRTMLDQYILTIFVEEFFLLVQNIQERLFMKAIFFNHFDGLEQKQM